MKCSLCTIVNKAWIYTATVALRTTTYLSVSCMALTEAAVAPQWPWHYAIVGYDDPEKPGPSCCKFEHQNRYLADVVHAMTCTDDSIAMRMMM